MFHAGNGSLALTVDALAVDPALRRSSGVRDAVDAVYQKKHKLRHLDRWHKLDAKTQQVLLDAGKKTELEMPALGDAIQDEEDAELTKRGVQVVQRSPANAAKVRKAFVDSIW